MPSLRAQNLKSFIDQWVRNYPQDAFTNMRMNAAFTDLIDWIDSSAGGIVTLPSAIVVTSGDFINATDCPLTELNGANLIIQCDQLGGHLWQEKSDWAPLVGGGFRITQAGFDSTTDNYRFVIQIS